MKKLFIILSAALILLYNRDTQSVGHGFPNRQQSGGIQLSDNNVWTGTNTFGSVTTTNLYVSGLLSVPSSVSKTLAYSNGGTTYYLNPEQCSNPVFGIEYPTSTENIVLGRFNATSTITKVVAVNKTNTDTVTFNLQYASSRGTASSTVGKVFTADQVITNTTTGSVLTTFASSTPNAGNYLIFRTSAASSTEFSLQWCWRENQ